MNIFQRSARPASHSPEAAPNSPARATNTGGTLLPRFFSLRIGDTFRIPTETCIAIKYGPTTYYYRGDESKTLLAMDASLRVFRTGG